MRENHDRHIGLFDLMAVHPHVRGDDESLRRQHLKRAGSPPRAWGRSHVDALFGPIERFTPTCVGTMHAVRNGQNLHSVHPHVRGDDFGYRLLVLHCRGSPPRAWGRSIRDMPNGSLERFTPTCVGTIIPTSLPASSPAVHPHVRGDDIFTELEKNLSGGSPPRAWGR